MQHRILCKGLKAPVWLIAALVLIFSLAACVEDALYLEAGSQGEPGNGEVYGLDSGSMYLVRKGVNWYPVKSDGTMGDKLSMLNHIELDTAIRNADLRPLAEGVTSITGFELNDLVCVYKFGRPFVNWYLVPWQKIGQGGIERPFPNPHQNYEIVTQYITNQRNMVVDLSLIWFTSRSEITLTDDAMGFDNTFIFVTPDIVNVTQNHSVTSGYSPDIIGGADWRFEIGSIRYLTHVNMFKIWVSDRPGEKGYFSISGAQPSRITKLSKRGSSETAEYQPPTLTRNHLPEWE